MRKEISTKFQKIKGFLKKLSTKKNSAQTPGLNSKTKLRPAVKISAGFCIFIVFFMVALFAFSSFTASVLTSADSESQITAEIKNVISIAVDADKVKFEILPNARGVFNSSHSTVKIFTNGDGYKLYMSAKNGNNTLQHTESSSNKDKLSALTVTNATSDQFEMNSWGYSLNSVNYNAVPTTTTLIKEVEIADTDDRDKDNIESPAYLDSEKYDKAITTEVYFGAKADTSVAAGSYTGSVIFDVTGSTVAPAEPSVSTASTSWTTSATVTANDAGVSRHEILRYEYIILKSDLSNDASKDDLTADALKKKPDGSDTEQGHGESVTLSAPDYADGIYYVYYRSYDIYGKHSNWQDAVIVKIKNTAPSNVQIARVSYNAVKISTTDSLIAGYCLTDSPDKPESTDSCFTNSETKTIGNKAANWYGYVKDAAGNVSNASAPLASYKVSLSESNATLTAKFENENGDTVSNGVYVLSGTPIYLAISVNEGSVKENITVNGEAKTSGSLIIVGNEDLTIVASAVQLGFGSYTTFQSFTESSCEEIPNGTTGSLQDTRDGKIYKVSKLADGNCWMIQNLALEGGTTLKATDSNVDSDYSLPASISSGFTEYYDAHMNNGSHTDGSSSSTGAYYNFTAATAGWATDAHKTEGETSPQDICPKGWHLPDGGSSGQFQKLYEAYSKNIADFDNAFGTIYVGYFYDASVVKPDDVAYWRSRTVVDGSRAYSLSEIISGNIDPVHPDGGRQRGFSVRCVTESDSDSVRPNHHPHLLQHLHLFLHRQHWRDRLLRLEQQYRSSRQCLGLDN